MYSAWIEVNYANGFYRSFSKTLRFFFFRSLISVGDVIYFLAIGWFVWKMKKFITQIIRRKITWVLIQNKLFRALIILLLLYVIFNLFWGLNYNRKSVSSNLHLEQIHMDTPSLRSLQLLLLNKVNESKLVLMGSGKKYPSNKELFLRARDCYLQSARQFSFIQYRYVSVKSSLYGWWGNYLGFTGYYNPFTGEAQVNTSIPEFIRPYTTLHEMAHQLGYAKEEEANFVGYLAAIGSTDTLFHYSAYLDLFVYANRELYLVDSVSAKYAATQLLPAVKSDIKEWRNFVMLHRNPLEPVITWLYGNYLKANQQPNGMHSYNEVILDLMAFYKKYGRI